MQSTQMTLTVFQIAWDIYSMSKECNKYKLTTITFFKNHSKDFSDLFILSLDSSQDTTCLQSENLAEKMNFSDSISDQSTKNLSQTK